MRNHGLALCTLILLQAASVPGLRAQEYSYDGNRWYEVEVTVFSNEYAPSGAAEIAVPERTRPAYLPRLRELQDPGSSFDVDFPGEAAPAEVAAFFPGVLPPTIFPRGLLPATENIPEPVNLGPPYSPAIRDSFKIADFTRDAFIDLTGQVAQFGAMVRNLERSGEHRPLWHKAWRQPMQGRAQAPAILIVGGDEYGAHNELEGNVRLSDNDGSVMLDIDVWLNRFGASPAPVETQWHIPERPFPMPASRTEQPDERVNDVLAVVPNWTLAEVWQLKQTRELGANQLYYLDHPALGVLIQIRPYELPARQTAADEADF